MYCATDCVVIVFFKQFVSVLTGRSIDFLKSLPSSVPSNTVPYVEVRLSQGFRQAGTTRNWVKGRWKKINHVISGKALERSPLWLGSIRAVWTRLNTQSWRTVKSGLAKKKAFKRHLTSQMSPCYSSSAHSVRMTEYVQSCLFIDAVIR